MYSPPPPYLLVFFFFLLQLVPSAKSAIQCYSDIFYPNSIYESNLNQLLTFLVSSTTSQLTYAVGVSPDRVHGEATCGYYSVTICYNCLVAARRDLKNVCYYKKSAAAFYRDCTLRYEPYNDVYTLSPPPPPPSPPVHSPPSPRPVLSAPPPSVGNSPTPNPPAKKLALYVAVPVGSGLIFLSLLLFLLWRRRRRGPPVNGHGQQEVNVLPLGK